MLGCFLGHLHVVGLLSSAAVREKRSRPATTWRNPTEKPPRAATCVRGTPAGRANVARGGAILLHYYRVNLDGYGGQCGRDAARAAWWAVWTPAASGDGQPPWCGPLVAAGFAGRWDVVECFGIWRRDRISVFSCCVVLTLCGYAYLPWAGGGGVGGVLCCARPVLMTG